MRVRVGGGGCGCWGAIGVLDCDCDCEAGGVAIGVLVSSDPPHRPVRLVGFPLPSQRLAVPHDLTGVAGVFLLAAASEWLAGERRHLDARLLADAGNALPLRVTRSALFGLQMVRPSFSGPVVPLPITAITLSPLGTPGHCHGSVC